MQDSYRYDEKSPYQLSMPIKKIQLHDSVEQVPPVPDEDMDTIFKSPGGYSNYDSQNVRTLLSLKKEFAKFGKENKKGADDSKGKSLASQKR